MPIISTCAMQRALLCDERDTCTINNFYRRDTRNVKQKKMLPSDTLPIQVILVMSAVAMLRRTRVVRCKRLCALT